MRIGLFDSGIGGQSVAAAIKLALPEHEIIYANDKQNLPYGTKTPAQLLGLVRPLLKRLVDQGCQVIVIACNTVTTTIINELRREIVVPLVGIEPMIKPAAEKTVSKVIAVCATPTTLSSQRYRQLKAQYAQGLTVLEPDCSDWAYLIENNQLNHSAIKQLITGVCQRGADIIVLGCTHYHWIEQAISEVAEQHQASVIQPEQAVIKQLKRVLARLP